MQRGAILLIFYVDIYSSLGEIINAQGLVFLGCYMHYTRSKFITNVKVCSTFFNQQCQHRVITILSNIMKCCKIFISFHVDPVAYFIFLTSRSSVFIGNCFPPSILKNDLETIGIITISAICKQTEVKSVFHYRQVEWMVWELQMFNQAF